VLELNKFVRQRPNSKMCYCNKSYESKIGQVFQNENKLEAYVQLRKLQTELVEVKQCSNYSGFTSLLDSGICRVQRDQDCPEGTRYCIDNFCRYETVGKSVCNDFSLENLRILITVYEMIENGQEKEAMKFYQDYVNRFPFC
jgi:hypothetical protein